MLLCKHESRRRGFIHDGIIHKRCSECDYYIPEDEYGLKCYCCGQKFRVRPHGATRKVMIEQLVVRY